MELLIKGARIIDCSKDFIGDVYIKDGLIKEIGKNINKGCNTLNGEGLVLLPSFIDLHCHFREPGFTYKEDIFSGSRAAVRGGYTAVNLMANTKPVCSSMEVVDYVLNKGKEAGLIHVHQTVSITKDFNGNEIDHIDLLDDRVKIISDDGRGVNSNKVMLMAMKKAREKGIIVMAHEEDSEIDDARLSENIMTFRDIYLCEVTKCHLHLAHVSTKEAMEGIILGKQKGLNITCEVAPHHIALTDEIEYKVNPPIRSREDRDFIIDAIKNGYVDAIATDHAPHTIEDKKNGAPGISGIETSFGVCFTKLVKEGNISLNKLSELMSKNPAELMQLNKGKIEIGYDGDLVLADIDNKYKVEPEKFQSKGKNTPFKGMELFGKVLTTIRGGKIVYREDDLDDNR